MTDEPLPNHTDRLWRRIADDTRDAQLRADLLSMLEGPEGAVLERADGPPQDLATMPHRAALQATAPDGARRPATVHPEASDQRTST